MATHSDAPAPLEADPRKDSLIEFPSLFPIKVMGAKVDGFVATMVAIAREFVLADVMRDTAMKPAQALKKLEEIKVKEARIRKTMNQDFVKLMDRQFEAACDAEDLRRHITSFEMGLRFRGVIDDDGKPA